MRFLTNWLCWTSSFSEFAMVHRIAVSSAFSFCSSFLSSLSRISLSFLNSAWTFCLSCCVWFFSNEREREEENNFWRSWLCFFFSLSITFQNNASKSALLRTTKSQKDSSLHSSIQNSHASLHCFWPPPTNLCQKGEHSGQNREPLSDVFFRRVKG